MKKSVLVVALLCLMSVFFLSSRSSALMVGLSTEELTKTSEVVVLGKVVKTKSYWGEGDIIITRAFVRVQKIINGNVVPKKIIVEYEGGEIGDVGFFASDMPTLKKGEKGVFFLESKKTEDRIINKNVYEITGNAQGKYTIGKDGIARRDGFYVTNDDDIRCDNVLPVNELINKIKEVKKHEK